MSFNLLLIPGELWREAEECSSITDGKSFINKFRMIWKC